MASFRILFVAACFGALLSEWAEARQRPWVFFSVESGVDPPTASIDFGCGGLGNVASTDVR